MNMLKCCFMFGVAFGMTFLMKAGDPAKPGATDFFGKWSKNIDERARELGTKIKTALTAADEPMPPQHVDPLSIIVQKINAIADDLSYRDRVSEKSSLSDVQKLCSDLMPLLKVVDVKNYKSTLGNLCSQANMLLGENSTAQFIKNSGTYILGEIPPKIGITRLGLIKKDNPDTRVGQIVCFGPRRYKKDDGTIVVINNDQAKKNCLRAEADSTEFGCVEVDGGLLMSSSDKSCEGNCWKDDNSCALPKKL